MSDNSLTSNKDTAVAYVLCKSVIDHTKITIDELIYLVSDALSSRTNVPSVEMELETETEIESMSHGHDGSTPHQYTGIRETVRLSL